MAGDQDNAGKSPEDVTDLVAQVWDLQQRLAAFEAERPVSRPETARVAERTSSDAMRIDAYRSPKIPTFFRSDPILWFVQVEASLRNARISVESTMADVVLAALDAEVVGCVKDIILTSPPPADIFQRIKSRIITTFAGSAEGNLRKLLKGQVLTDGKPSLVLSRLRNLNDGQCDDAVVRSIFLDQLPSNHRAILVATGAEDLERLAEVADKIADNAGSVEVCAASSVGGSSSGLGDEVARLASCVATLTTQVERLTALSSTGGARSRTRFRSRTKSKGRSGSRKRDKSGLCHAHKKFPHNPLSCREWCSQYAVWKQKN